MAIVIGGRARRERAVVLTVGKDAKRAIAESHFSVTDHGPERIPMRFGQKIDQRCRKDYA
jgi:hypothetical protein